MPLLEIKNLTLGYENQIVVRDISFNVEDKDFILVVGSNGAGKSTLIKGILGLIKPIKGEVSFNDIKRTNVGYMPQETKVDAHFPSSVSEIVLSGALNSMGLRPFYSKKEKKRLDEVLNCLKISDLKNKNFSELSGGQRQKVLLARSLMATTRLLVLDEPSNNLDQEAQADFYERLVHLNKAHGNTIIMITHDVLPEELIGNKVLYLNKDGYFFGSTKEYLEVKKNA